MSNLLINIDHVATLRNARRERLPDPAQAAILCELAGADGIVFHLREDRRHINERDVRVLKEVVSTKLDFELSLADEIVAICCEIKPDLATLVPERREEITTESGLDVTGNQARLEETISRLQGEGVEVSLFVDPSLDQIKAAKDVGADCIELHTGAFAEARDVVNRTVQIEKLSIAAAEAYALGMKVHAGHGLDYHNYPVFDSGVPYVKEVSIGFAVMARALMVGLETAVRDMRMLVKGY